MPPARPRPTRANATPGPRCNPGRAAAYARLAAEAERYPEFSLDALETPGASERDAALGHAIYDAAVRRWLTISYLCGKHLRQRWDELQPGVLGALLGGAAQILLFDRIPTHSAIDESVEWTKHAVNPGAGGLVNAVLRKVAGCIARDAAGEAVRRPSWGGQPDELPLADGQVLVLQTPMLPREPTRCAAAATGIPVWQIKQWADQLGEDDALHVAWHAVAGAPTIVHTPRGGVEDTNLATHESPAHRVFTGSRADLVELLKSRDELWVQDPTASAAVDLAEDLKPETVVDLCAGRGTKTRQLLERFPDAQVIACEVSEPRLADLRGLRRESGDRVTVLRPEQAARELAGRCNLVLTDVPCSNSGVLARRVEARHRCGARQLARLSDQQREIVASAVQLLAPGGILLYSTCSLESQENTAITAWATRAFGLIVEQERLRLPAGGPGRPASEYQDGGFAAVLRAPGGSVG